MNTITELQKYHDEINERCNNLLAFIKSDDAKLIHDDDRHLISLEYGAASELLCVLRRKIIRAQELKFKVALDAVNGCLFPKLEFGDPSEFWKEEFMV